MSKIIAIGDIHGLDTWRQIVEQEFDKCIFVGDYFDSYDIDTDTQIQNFKNILEFKKQNKDKVILLMGNHDLHYLLASERYSGYQHYRAVDIKEALISGLADEELLQYAHIEGDYLFSHAGVTKTWAKDKGVDLINPADSINDLSLNAFGFNENRDKSMCGEHKSQGPMWVRPQSLKEDAIEGYIQVVGHTRHSPLLIEDKFIFIDSLWDGQYLTINDGIPYVSTQTLTE
jgi:predicted phosphodiesterase